MTDAITQFANQFVWMPLLIWTVAAGLCLAALRFRWRRDWLLQLDARIALLASLPMTLVLARFVPPIQIPVASGATDLSVVTVLTPVVETVSAAPSTQVEPSISALALLTLAAALLSLVGIVRLVFGYLHLVRTVRRARPLRRWPNGVEVMLSDEVTTPLACGVLHKRILLPVGYEHTAIALEHEAWHHRSGDVLRAWLVAVVRGLFWFHPLVHLIAARVPLLGELVCDQRVLASGSVDEADYRAALLASASPGRWLVGSIAMARETSALRTRIDMLNDEATTTRPALLAWQAALPLALVTLVGACGPPELVATEQPDLIAERMALPASSAMYAPAELDHVPELAGGVGTLSRLLHHPSVECPPPAGRSVILEFDLDPSGYASAFEVLDGLSDGCNREAMRVLGSVQLAPALKDGKRVWTRMSLPLSFRRGARINPSALGGPYTEDLRQLKPAEDPGPVQLYRSVTDVGRPFAVLGTSNGPRIADDSTWIGLARAVGAEGAIVGIEDKPAELAALGLEEERRFVGIIYLDAPREDYLSVHVMSAAGETMTVFSNRAGRHQSIRYLVPANAVLRIVDLDLGETHEVGVASVQQTGDLTFANPGLSMVIHRDGTTLRRIQNAASITINLVEAPDQP